MKTIFGTDCGSAHIHTSDKEYGISTINGRRYTFCTHRMSKTSNEYCGQGIDVTDRPAIVYCCGNHNGINLKHPTNGLPV